MPARRLPTLEDVAARAGVSRATASRAVNLDPRVRSQSRLAVEAAVTELGYRPNRAARSLVIQEVDSIAVVVPEAEDRVFADPFFASMLASITQRLADSPVQVLLAMGQPGGRQKIERYLRGGYTDGAIIVSHHRDDDLSGVLHETKLPAVYVGRPYAGDVGIPWVDVDNNLGATLAAEHLIGLGRRRLATIAGPQDMAAGSDRLAGWRAALDGAGLDSDLVEFGDFTSASGAAAMERLLERAPELDGVFVASDLMAVAAMHEMQSRGIAVPEQIAVVGFDDSHAAQLTRPPLTTVINPVGELAGRAVDLLLQLMKGEAVDPVVLQTQMVKRTSG